MRLVERERECAAAQALVDGAAGGAGGLLVIEGPPGIGKSVLLSELAGRARAAGLAVRSARGTRLGSEVPFALARWLLEPAVRTAPAALGAGWARHARPLFQGEVRDLGNRRQLVEGLVALVAELHRVDGPLVLIVDDAHWGDPCSLEFLGELGVRSVDMGVVVAVATGEGGGDDGLSLRRAAVAGGARRLAPAPLSPGAVRELVRRRLPDAGEAFAARVAQATGGNPLLVAEVIDSAEGQGTEGLPISEGLSGNVLLWLEDAGPQARVLGEAVAVLGEAPLRLAAALAGLGARAADRAADELVARHVFAAGEPLRFAQPLVGEAVSAAIAPFELAARHRRAAELLDGDGAGPDQIAGHLVRSRPGAEQWVAGVLRQAARTAASRGAPTVAAELLERALAAAGG